MQQRSGMEVFAGLSGVAAAMVFSNLGAAYGMGKAGTGIAGMGQRYPGKIVKALLPVIMASILGIYGLIISVMILKKVDLKNYSWKNGYWHMASGLSCGLSSLVAGYAIGIVGEIGVRKIAQQEKIFVGMLLILIFAEAIALYGMILGIMISSD